MLFQSVDSLEHFSLREMFRSKKQQNKIRSKSSLALRKYRYSVVSGEYIISLLFLQEGKDEIAVRISHTHSCLQKASLLIYPPFFSKLLKLLNIYGSFYCVCQKGLAESLQNNFLLLFCLYSAIILTFLDSFNHRIIEVRQKLWRSSCPTHFLSRRATIAQDSVWTVFCIYLCMGLYFSRKIK